MRLPDTMYLGTIYADGVSYVPRAEIPARRGESIKLIYSYGDGHKLVIAVKCGDKYYPVRKTDWRPVTGASSILFNMSPA